MINDGGQNYLTKANLPLLDDFRLAKDSSPIVATSMSETQLKCQVSNMAVRAEYSSTGKRCRNVCSSRV